MLSIRVFGRHVFKINMDDDDDYYDDDDDVIILV